MPDTIALSEAALALLRSRLAGQKPDVAENRQAYRELVAAGLMIPLHTMTGGDESAYRLTEAAVIFSTPPSSPAASPAPLG